MSEDTSPGGKGEVEMTREEAKKLFRNDKDSYGKPKAIMHKIDRIYDDFEKKLTDEEIEEWADKKNEFLLDTELTYMELLHYKMGLTDGAKCYRDKKIISPETKIF